MADTNPGPSNPGPAPDPAPIPAGCLNPAGLIADLVGVARQASSLARAERRRLVRTIGWPGRRRDP
ncbi:MAG: hypothetical protein ACK5RL_15125 [Acidimicrobiales bacterium]